MTSVSVVIRVRNEGKTLAQVLDALRYQTIEHEVIVVDSGSNDDTLGIAQNHNAHIIAIPRQSFSYGYALNTGFSAARGEIGVSLAGHAVPANTHWLEELIRPFGAAGVAGSASRLMQHWWYRSWALTGFDLIYRYLGIHSQGVTTRLFVNSSSAIRLSIWRRFPFNEDLASCEDQLWARQVALNGYTICYCPASQVIHWHRQNLSSKLRSVRRDWLATQQVNHLLRK